MTARPPLNLNLATRPRRNRRLYKTLIRGLAAFLCGLAALAAFAVLKYGGGTARLKASIAEARKLRDEAQREQKRLTADIRAEEKLSLVRVNLVNGIILKKTFSWTTLLSEIEAALPAPSFIIALTPGFTAEGAVALRLRLTSRSLDDLLAFITDLTARGFKDIQVNDESRSNDGRLITGISLTYERPF